MSNLTLVTEQLIQATHSPAIAAQITDWEIQGKKVKAYRDYYDGDHPANMTKEMRQLLRVALGPDGSDEFNDNYMQVIVDTMADRLNLDTLETDNDAATEWVDQVQEDNYIDALQMDIHEAAIRDSVTYVMVEYDNDAKRVKLTHELAYDGTSGMLALYKSASLKEMAAAVKIWVLTAEGSAVTDTIRVNVYLPDRVLKFVSKDGSTLTRYLDDPTAPNGEAIWGNVMGQPLGIPVIAFFNKERQNQGLSELDNAIPLQNALNRVLHSIVMTSELDAFRIKTVIGAPAPKALTPGMIAEFGADGLTPEQAAAIKLGEWGAGDMQQQLETARWIKGEIGTNTRTPAPEFLGGDNASGEALKQRWVGLIGKVKRFMVKAGAAWCKVFDTAWYVQAAYGDTPPDYERIKAKWADPELRNDQVTIDNAVKIKDDIPLRVYYRLLAPIYHWTEDDIDQMVKDKMDESGARVAAMAAQLPSFTNAQYDLGAMPEAGQRMMQPVGGNGNGNGTNPMTEEVQ